MNKCRVESVFYCGGYECDYFERGAQVYGFVWCEFYKLGKCVNKDAQEMALKNKENER